MVRFLESNRVTHSNDAEENNIRPYPSFLTGLQIVWTVHRASRLPSPIRGCCMPLLLMKWRKSSPMYGVSTRKLFDSLDELENRLLWLKHRSLG